MGVLLVIMCVRATAGLASTDIVCTEVHTGGHHCRLGYKPQRFSSSMTRLVLLRFCLFILTADSTSGSTWSGHRLYR